MTADDDDELSQASKAVLYGSGCVSCSHSSVAFNRHVFFFYQIQQDPRAIAYSS